MTAAGIYARLSPVPADKRHLDATGASLGGGRQQTDGAALAESRGWTVAERYTDDDKSAFSGKARPAYDRMIADLRSGAIDAVVAWHPDRLHRTPRELEDFIDVIEQTGIQIATCTAGDIDLATSDGRALARIACVIARKESEDKSRRLCRKHTEIAERGRPSGGGCRPFGYEADKITVVPVEAAAIREAARRVLAGDSVRSIVFDWRERELATVKGGYWTTTTVRGLLKSARISGQREHRGAIVGPAVWPAIITPTETARLRAIFADGARDKVGGKRARSYLLSGFLTCGACDSKLVTRPGRGTRRYLCASDRGGCNRVGINAPRLEAWLTEVLLVRFDSSAVARLMADDQGDDVDSVALAQDLEAQLEQLARDHYVDRLIGRAEFLAARTPLEGRLAAARELVARRRPVHVLDGIGSEDDGLRSAWPALPLDRRRAILGSVLESVRVMPVGEVGNRFDPGRVARTVAWRM